MNITMEIRVASLAAVGRYRTLLRRWNKDQQIKSILQNFNMAVRRLRSVTCTLGIKLVMRKLVERTSCQHWPLVDQSHAAAQSNSLMSKSYLLLKVVSSHDPMQVLSDGMHRNGQFYLVST
jgi:hypothetical protein